MRTHGDLADALVGLRPDLLAQCTTRGSRGETAAYHAALREFDRPGELRAGLVRALSRSDRACAPAIALAAIDAFLHHPALDREGMAVLIQSLEADGNAVSAAVNVLCDQRSESPNNGYSRALDRARVASDRAEKRRALLILARSAYCRREPREAMERSLEAEGTGDPNGYAAYWTALYSWTSGTITEAAAAFRRAVATIRGDSISSRTILAAAGDFGDAHGVGALQSQVAIARDSLGSLERVTQGRHSVMMPFAGSDGDRAAKIARIDRIISNGRNLSPLMHPAEALRMGIAVELAGVEAWLLGEAARAQRALPYAYVAGADALRLLRQLQCAPARAEALLTMPAHEDQARTGRAVHLTDVERGLLPHLESTETLSSIAVTLGKSRKTVSNQVGRLYRKLAVSSRSEALAATRRLGLR